MWALGFRPGSSRDGRLVPSGAHCSPTISESSHPSQHRGVQRNLGLEPIQCVDRRLTCLCAHALVCCAATRAWAHKLLLQISSFRYPASVSRKLVSSSHPSGRHSTPKSSSVTMVDVAFEDTKATIHVEEDISTTRSEFASHSKLAFQHTGPPVVLTAEEERRLYRKIDLKLIPVLTLLQLLSFMDRGAVQFTE